MPFYTEQGRKDLCANRDILEGDLAHLRRKIREEGSVTPRIMTGDDMHTCTEHLESDRELFMLMQRLLGLEDLIRTAHVVYPPRTTDRLQIGHIATLQIYTEEGERLGEPKKYLIGGFEASNMEGNIPIIAYTAPIICSFMGMPVDDLRDPTKLVLGGKRRLVELIAIELYDGEI